MKKYRHTQKWYEETHDFLEAIILGIVGCVAFYYFVVATIILA